MNRHILANPGLIAAHQRPKNNPNSRFSIWSYTDLLVIGPDKDFGHDLNTMFLILFTSGFHVVVRPWVSSRVFMWLGRFSISRVSLIAFLVVC